MPDRAMWGRFPRRRSALDGGSGLPGIYPVKGCHQRPGVERAAAGQGQFHDFNYYPGLVVTASKTRSFTEFRDPQQGAAVAWEGAGEFAGDGFEVLLAPQVAGAGGTGDAESGQIEGDWQL